MCVRGWWWKLVSDFENLELSCTVCGRIFAQSDAFYTARNPDEEQVELVQSLFSVDIFCDFDVCHGCVADTPFDWWLEERWEERHKLHCERAPHDWMREGF